MDYGKIYKSGNFTIMKFTKTLGRKELLALREEMKLPKEFWKTLPRNCVPYIKVSTLSGMWQVHFAVTTAMYHFIESMIDRADELAGIFSMMLADTTLLGDEGYYAGKTKLISEFMDRQKSSDAASDEDLDLDVVKSDMEAREKITEVANAIKNEVEDGGR